MADPPCALEFLDLGLGQLIEALTFQFSVSRILTAIVEDQRNRGLDVQLQVAGVIQRCAANVEALERMEAQRIEDLKRQYEELQVIENVPAQRLN